MLSPAPIGDKLKPNQAKFETAEQGISSIENTMHIHIPGMGTANMDPGEGPTALVEFYNGVWTLYVWADINKENPTHEIDLSGALESNRGGE